MDGRWDRLGRYSRCLVLMMMETGLHSRLPVDGH